MPESVDNLDEVLATFGYTTRVDPSQPADDLGEYKYFIATNAVTVGVNQLDALRLQLGPAVPEPSAALGAVGLGAIGLLRRRRRARVG